MLCGLFADSHNNKTNIQKALTRFSQEGVVVILHAGDITSVQTLQLLQGYDVWIAQGNMDRDPGLRMQSRLLFGPGRFLPLHKIRLQNKHIALLHSDLHPEWSTLVNSGLYDYIVIGHTHTTNDVMFGNTRIINPGSLAGTRFKAPSCAILDILTDTLTWVSL
jgi:putative phosphoesterase